MRLPWQISGEESVCQCRRHRFDPWLGKIPHATEQLGPCAITSLYSRAQEPQLLSQGATTIEACIPESLCSATGEVSTKGSPRSAARVAPTCGNWRKVSAQQRRLSATKIHQSIKFKKTIYTVLNCLCTFV